MSRPTYLYMYALLCIYTCNIHVAQLKYTESVIKGPMVKLMKYNITNKKSYLVGPLFGGSRD